MNQKIVFVYKGSKVKGKVAHEPRRPTGPELFLVSLA